MTTTADRALWQTVRGAPTSLPVAWVAWLGVAALASVLLAGRLGPAGAVIPILAVGWVIARRAPLPPEGRRQYHLDDLEVTSIGPGARVVRLPWSAVETVTQGPSTLGLSGAGVTIGLPLRASEPTVWSAVLALAVPGLAQEMWERLEDGEEMRLRSTLQPTTRALAWWAYPPALLAGLVSMSLPAVSVAVALALAERGVAWLGTRRGTVILHRAGLAIRVGLRRVLLSWSSVEVLQGSQGLYVDGVDGVGGRIGAGLPNFWVAAPVIEMKARLGASSGATVHFRVRLADGGLEVVGEIEPMA